MRVRIAISLFLCITGLFCDRESHSQPKSAEAAPAQRTEFIPSPDSTVTVDQLRCWMRCNQLLDSLSFFYQDSFAMENPAKRLEHQNNFTKAQDRLCVIAGLSGGYDEYLWILHHAGLPRNKPALDSLGLDAL